MDEIKDEIVFNGVVYRLMGAGKYYLSQSNTNEGRRHAKGLHVAIWEHYSGKKVPNGYCIHHIDGNTFNNDFANLECINISEHQSKHGLSRYQNNRDSLRDNLSLGKEYAKEWHSSREGVMWHSEHAKEIIKNNVANLEPKKCQNCGAEFQPNVVFQRFCCKKCARRYRYLQTGE